MARLSAESHTRVTFALDIIGKIRTGPLAGFHELAALKHQISLYDIITVEESRKMQIACNHPAVPCNEKNICWKACDVLKKSLGITHNVTITIEKTIPVQGGLAGGSANAATVFMLLNDLWGLGLDNKKMSDLSRQTGMDVPFYFTGGTALDTEAGGTLEPIATSLYFDLVLILPDFGISTAQAYAALDYSLICRDKDKTTAMKRAFAANDADTVARSVHNDFELSVFPRYPLLAEIKKRLLAAGCTAAVLSGSGSTVVGILNSPADYEKIKTRVGFKSLFVTTKPSYHDKGASNGKWSTRQAAGGF
jgi:4-diphosphocytidyl-2-C-methyl-D-erythritol kinase